MSAPCSAIYDNRTTHTRFAPFKRRFSYRVPQLFLDIDPIGETAAGLSCFSYNRPGLFSFYDCDHGGRSGAPLRAWAEAQFARAGLSLDGGPIRLLTFPRVLGRAFNPLSIFFGYGRDGALRGLVYEVNNTFGQTHAYVAVIEPGRRTARHAAQKRFYVSPFFDVRGCYRFAITRPEDHFSLTIENIVERKRVHLATLSGARRPLTDAALLRCFISLPWMGFRVIFAIHWQALWLWLRGARYRPPPPTPLAGVSQATHTSEKPKLDEFA